MWSDFYQNILDEFKIKSSTKVISCAPSHEGNNVIWVVYDRKGKMFTFNLFTSVVHLGHLYVIPTCSCGDWCSYFVWCQYILLSSMSAGIKLEDMQNLRTLYS